MAGERAALARRLRDLLPEIPNVLGVRSNELCHLAGYRILEPEGLAHSCIVRDSGNIVILAATSRFLKHPTLRRRLFALRRLAELEFRRVLIATPRGILHATNRLRSQRRAGPASAPSGAGR